MSLYYREQKHICGKDYDTAPYMEVDLYPVSGEPESKEERSLYPRPADLQRQPLQEIPCAACKRQLRKGRLLMDGNL